jgi:hypothetical protein
MKKVLIFLMALSLFTACNNDKGKLDKKADYREKDDYGTNDDQSNEKSRKDDDNNSDENTSSDGWTRSDENKFVAECADEATKNVGETRANQYCDCMLKKIKKMYSSYNEANLKLGRLSKEQIDRLAADCNNNNEDNNNSRVEDNDKSNNGGNGWPEVEIKEFVTNCVKEAKKKGMEYLDAQSYCDCMQYKLEKLYPNVYDKRLKNIDMESPSITRMVQSCLPGN